MDSVTIEINMDKKCSRCGKPGACQNGLCLDCITKRVIDGYRRKPNGTQGRA